jgi:hypothetical protein
MSRARMAELVDAPASGAGAGNGVEVRVLFRAPFVLPRTSLNILQKAGKPANKRPLMYLGVAGCFSTIRIVWGHGWGHIAPNAPICRKVMPPNGAESTRNQRFSRG